MTNMTFITSTETVHTGGNCMVDILTMSDGRVITVTDECIVVNANIEEFWNSEGTDDPDQIIWLV